MTAPFLYAAMGAIVATCVYQIVVLHTPDAYFLMVIALLLLMIVDKLNKIDSKLGEKHTS